MTVAFRLIPPVIAFQLLLASHAAHADLNIILKNTFIEQYKLRAAITAKFKVDKATKPHAPKDDADIHIAGRSDDVGLPMVAEIMNAAEDKPALAAVTAATGGEPVRVTGAWRLWTEHGGIGDQIQGDPVPPPSDTNPAHVFEIHPIVDFAGHSVAASLHPIAGYTPKEAHAAFVKYEGTKSSITPGANTTTITTTMAGYNYVDFVIEPTGEQKEVEGGRFVMAKVFSPDCQLLVHNRRMVFLAGTPPETQVKALPAGGQLRVLGIPRIDLSLVSWRTHCAQNQIPDQPGCAAKHPDVLQWSLPYEMIIVGIGEPVSCTEP
jgi:hypothetical protein